MSIIEKILGEIRDRANVLREHVDRGRYDGLKLELQDKMQEFLNEGTDAIHKFYKKKHGMLYTIKSEKDEKHDITRLYEIVKSHEYDLTNRLNLLNYYTRQNIQDPNECKNMSQEKCSRGENIRNCLWVPGSDEYGEWTPDPWNQRKPGGKLPEYVGTNLHQRPRGCYPVKQNTDFDNAGKMGTSTLADRGREILSTLPVQEKQLTASQKAEDKVKVKPLTKEQQQKRQQRIEANRKQYAEMLAKIHRRTRESEAKTPSHGGRKTRKKRRKRKTKRRKQKRKTKRKRKKRKTRKKKKQKGGSCYNNTNCFFIKGHGKSNRKNFVVPANIEINFYAPKGQLAPAFYNDIRDACYDIDLKEGGPCERVTSGNMCPDYRITNFKGAKQTIESSFYAAPNAGLYTCPPFYPNAPTGYKESQLIAPISDNGTTLGEIVTYVSKQGHGTNNVINCNFCRGTKGSYANQFFNSIPQDSPGTPGGTGATGRFSQQYNQNMQNQYQINMNQQQGMDLDD